MKKICFTILITLLVTVISYAQLAGGLKITSNPSNVTVKFNGVKKGVTPFKVILKAGSYTVTSEKYLNEFEKYYCKEKVTLIAGKINVLHLSLEKTYISAEKKAKKLAAENKIEVEKQAVIDLSRKKDLEANIGKFTDFRDNKTYKTIKIGKQIWMSENLAFNRYNESFAYNNDQDNVNKYGYLYIWKSAQYACPLGYHLPTKDEFKTLLDNYGGSSNIEANYVALMPSGNSGFFVLLLLVVSIIIF